jgi:hypothetical protein
MSPSEDLKVNALLLNRDGFQMPADGWYQIAPVGEFPHSQAGLVQVVDREACEGDDRVAGPDGMEGDEI